MAYGNSNQGAGGGDAGLGGTDGMAGRGSSSDRDGAGGITEAHITLDQEIAHKYDPSALSRLVMRDAGRGEPLDLHTRSLMEQRLGGSFGNVRLFRGPLAEEITQRYRADAVTVGGTELILVREGARSNFQSAAGASLLAHELTHVQQQQRGLHFASSDGSSGGTDIEREAEHNEARAYDEAQGRIRTREHTKKVNEQHNKMWEQVRQEVLKMHHEEKDSERTRDGGFGT